MKKNLFKLLPMMAACMMATACDDGDGYGDGWWAGYGNYADAEDGVPMPMGGDRFDEFQDNPFISVKEQPVSTFSVDADGASYAIVRRYLNGGYTGFSTGSVRIEEFLNYFTFDYAQPTGDDAVAINAEVGACPWNSGHLLLRLGLKGRELALDEVPLANFVFLVDVSGSMEGSDRLGLLKAGLTELLGKMRPDDRISLVTYSGKVEKVLESTPVREADKIRKAIGQLHASGSTAGGEALKMAYEEALSCYDPTKNNRVIMGTDGDFNVGVTSTEALVEMAEGYAKRGIYFTCLGFGMGNLNDSMMEQLSNKCNGTYHYIDCEDEMMKVLVHERERFVSVANDVKCQLTFNPDVVSRYRLIGYENRVMQNEDFDDDEKDAAEIGAGQTITALYELEPAVSTELTASEATADKAADEAIAFDVRYKKSLGTASIALSQKLAPADLSALQPLSENMSLAAGIAAFGMVLRQSPHKGEATLDMARELVKQSLAFDPHGYRAQLLQLIDKAK